eukprot:TRINITY_DN95439_c0_g1_i1.p1 TRINITY_DN95439_c0_g1~~TRINITY_DN95439_c0_g1_i1.p1  ORF type:complete len:189 (-),score=27.15 TRINITY_DN95439_c0_g1_i1:26-592(-)
MKILGDDGVAAGKTATEAAVSEGAESAGFLEAATDTSSFRSCSSASGDARIQLESYFAPETPSTQAPTTPQDPFGERCGGNFSSVAGSNEPVESSMCVACMEKEAVFVCKGGHVILCRGCRRKMIHKQLKTIDATWKRKSARDLQARQLDRTAVPCPLCRQESRFILERKHQGHLIAGQRASEGLEED